MELSLNETSCPKRRYSNCRLYRVWGNIRYRCYNPKSKAYKNYGGRGITMCNEWKRDFFSFYGWAIQNGYNDNLTIDRINNNEGYSPMNCRFVDRIIQGRNQRIRFNSNSGYKGVNLSKRVNGVKWRSRITVNKKTIWLGVYDTPELANEARIRFIADNDLRHFS